MLARTLFALRLQVSLCICQTFLYPFLLEGFINKILFRKSISTTVIYTFKSIQVFQTEGCLFNAYHYIQFVIAKRGMMMVQPPDIMTVNNTGSLRIDVAFHHRLSLYAIPFI